MVKLSCKNSGVGLLRINFLVCPNRMMSKLTLHRLMWDLEQQIIYIYIDIFFLDFRHSQRLRGGMKRSQKFQPTFKIGSNIRRANKLWIEIILRDRSNPWLRASIKDFTYNSNKNLIPWLMLHFRFLMAFSGFLWLSWTKFTSLEDISHYHDLAHHPMELMPNYYSTLQ